MNLIIAIYEKKNKKSLHIFPSFDFIPLDHPYIASNTNAIWMGTLPVSKLAKKFNLKLTRKQCNLLIEILELILKDAHKVIRGNRVATQYKTLAKKLAQDNETVTENFKKFLFEMFKYVPQTFNKPTLYAAIRPNSNKPT